MSSGVREGGKDGRAHPVGPTERHIQIDSFYDIWTGYRRLGILRLQSLRLDAKDLPEERGRKSLEAEESEFFQGSRRRYSSGAFEREVNKNDMWALPQEVRERG